MRNLWNRNVQDSPKKTGVAIRSGSSIQYPPHRYLPSKNPYWAKLKNLAGIVYSDHETEVHAGAWRSRFLGERDNPDRKLHVEVGCNAGHVVLEWAALNPNSAYIGIDWKFKSIFRAAEKANRRGLKNVLFLRAHAEYLSHVFGEGEVDYLYLYFPDPWPKNSHHKHRLMTSQRFREFAKIMKPSGIFHIKTDHSEYFDWILKAVTECSDLWQEVEVSRNLHQNHPAPHTLKIPDVTLFEKLFIQDGLPIYSLKLSRKPHFTK